MKEKIHFVHGNGFPSTCYKQLFNLLEQEYDCCFLDKVGHDSNFPVTPNWHYLIAEVINSIKEQSKQPVIAVGHSLGGVLSLMASIEEPSLFKAVVLLDSPLIGWLKSTCIRISRAIGIIDRVTPAAQTKFRRKHWSTREEIVTYLKSRELFKNFDDRCLNDYIDYGMQKDETGFRLRFDPSIEYQIYRTIPDSCYQYEGKLKIPTTLLYAEQSHLIRNRELRYMKQKFGINYFKIQGTHMFPFEYPELCALKVKEAIGKMLVKREGEVC